MAKTLNSDNQKSQNFTAEELDRLVKFFEILIEIDQAEKARFRRLVQEPNGFSMSGEGRNCPLCERSIYDSGWFDKWGFKCLNCQDAIDRRKIPSSLCRDRDHTKAIPDTTLAIKLGIKVNQIRKLIREGKIIARPISHGPNIIIKKDNPNLRKIW